MNLDKVIEEFNNYIKNYDMKVKEINLKYHHSFKVMELMKRLAISLNLKEEDIILAEIIGLLHDIGRFEQLSKFNTFNDFKSEDHADQSCIYLFVQKHIRDFIKEDKYDSIIYQAIKNHNKYEIDKKVKDPKELLFSKMIRDVDRIDIYRVMVVYYEREFIKEDISKEIINEFLSHKQCKLDKKKSKTDATIIQLSFINDFNFNESYDLLVDTDNFELYLNNIDVDKSSEEAFLEIKKKCFEIINKGVVIC